MANSQANSIVEIIHQFIASLVHTSELNNIYLDKDDPWLGVLEAKAFLV